MSVNVLAIDTGKHGCGVAMFMGGSLSRALFVPSPVNEAEDRDKPFAGVALALAVEAEALLRPDVVVIETMRSYTTSPARPADLLVLQGIGYACAARFPDATIVGVEASVWKGQVPRTVMAARLAAKAERLGWTDHIEAPRLKTHLNDVLHAIGIGVFWLGKHKDN